MHGKPLPVEPLPSGVGRVLKSTRLLWESFFTSGRWSTWDDTQRASAQGLVRTHDEAERAEGRQRIALLREVRLTGARLGVNEPKRKPTIEREHERAPDPERAKRAAMTPEDRARYELAALTE